MARPPLADYHAKRDFGITAEPAGKALVQKRSARPTALSFVVQKHWASRLHYDFRLELDGVLLSWAVPKGPSLDPSKMQMAIHVEDHPLDYAAFEGTIPAKQYGAGRVIVWDRGTWEPVGDPREGMVKGKVLFKLHGEKLAGLWELVRIAKPGDKQDPWMLFKKKDAWARPLADYDVIAALPDSVVAKPLGLVETREPRESGAKGAPGRSGKSRDTARADLSAAVPAPLPARLGPQLATLVTAPPNGDWIVETKFDGYRLMARIEDGKATLVTRGGHDWTSKMPALAADLESMQIGSAWLDGEIIVMGRAGIPDFNALQNAMDSASSSEIEYFVFDLPFHGGRDLRQVPLLSRRAVLREVVGAHPADRVRLSQTFDAAPAQMLEAACAMQLEGIILKRADAPYVSARTETWLKLKCSLRQEFVICGFTDRANAAAEVGSLLLGYFEAGTLTYAGNVGTGWDARTGHDMHARLAKLEVDKPLFAAETVKPGRWGRRTAGGERWVAPTLVAEVAFREWTPDGHVRHAVFQGLRVDRAATTVVREVALQTVGAAAPPPPAASVKVTNPDRVVDASTGLTKVALVRYYESIAERMLPHLRDRPVSLVRAPEGIAGELFFQKHPETRMPGLRVLDKIALAEPLRIARGRHGRSPALGGADEHHRVPHLELDRCRHRPARPHDLRPRPGRGRRLGPHPGGGDPGARDAHRTLARQLAEDERWEGPARGRAARAGSRLRHGQGVFAGDRAAPREDDSAAVRGEERRLEPRRQDLHRLPPQRPRPDHGGGVLGPIEAGSRRLHARVVGAARQPEGRRAVDDHDRPRVPQLRAV